MCTNSNDYLDQNQAIDGLTSEERQELEELREQKAQAQAKKIAEAERRELEMLRAEKAKAQKKEQALRQKAVEEIEQTKRIAEIRKKNREFMEPDEDLHMAKGQKITLAIIALLVLLVVIKSLVG